MKKIININLSGRVIPIEDSAYEKLQSYIESLRRYFANEEGRDEIINDIESRIAELMNEKVHKGSSAITDDDINEIIASMGRPEDFDAETAETTDTLKQSAGQDYSYSERRRKRRLYRDSSDKFIGGVCSGIANYLNTDPAIVRILFAIVTFGGFGVGFLIYILLWMLLPATDLDDYSGKRLYRNPDDRIIGGVAGGLAAYFNTRTSTMRLIFAAPIALSILMSILDGISWRHNFDFFPNIVFGSLSGTFILAYVILWMVLPEARSTYEKMEMRGEKVDVNSIRQNVKEGIGNVKERVKGWSGEVKESAQNFSNKAKEFANTKGKAFAKEVGETARRSRSGLGHAIGILFKVFFLFIAGTIAFALFVALIALIFGGVAWWPINNFLWTSKWQQLYAWGTLIFFLGVPLIGFITWVIRRIIRVRSRSSYLGWTFGFLWIVGWVAAILFTASVVKDFRDYEHTDSTVTINQPPANKMIIAVSQPELEYTGSFGWINNNGEEGWDLSEDTLKMSTVRFNVIASKDSAYYVTIKKYSYGKTEAEAIRRAEKIKYTVFSKDSVLDLANGYAIDKDSKFRFQQVEIEILVPVGKKLRFDKSIKEKLNPANFRVRRTYRRRGGIDIQFNDDYSFRFRSDVDYIMGIDGNLRDVAGKPVVNDDYRYDNKSDTNNTLEEQRKKVEEEQRRLKQMEEREIKKKNSNTGKSESMDNKENDAMASSPSAIFSLVKMFN
jgi:phage shock protein PspC (stress-responsive transcriptional regulator)